MQTTDISESDLRAEVRRIRRLTVDQRRAAAKDLGETGGLASAIVLLRLLDERSPWVRSDVLEALARIGGPLARIGAQLMLGDATDWIRSEAAQLLGEIGTERDVFRLARALEHDEDWCVRSDAADALGNLGFRSACRSLERALREDAHAVVRRDVALALANIADRSAIEVLSETLAAETEDIVKVQIHYALYVLGERCHLDALLDILEHHMDPLVLDNVINVVEPKALAPDDNRRVIAGVQRLLENESVTVKPGKWAGLRGDARILLQALISQETAGETRQEVR